MKRKVNIDREKPSPEEIRSRKDFKSVLQQYSAATAAPQAKPIFKSTGFLVSAAIGLVAVISALTWYNFSTKPEANNMLVNTTDGGIQETVAHNQESEGADQKKAFIAPPLKNIDIPVQKYTLNAAKGGEFTSSSGSTIHIPQNAFADANGTVLQGDVDLHFREFHDAVDFFVSGIPMSYDSAGKQYQFESAGMVEVTGFKDSKPVRIAAGKKLDIKLKSVSAGRSFNLYRLDTVTRNWVYVGKDLARSASKTTLAVTDKKSNTIAASSNRDARKFEAQPEVIAIDKKMEEAKAEGERQIAQLPALPDPPQKPMKANASHQRFNIDVDPSEFPEMKQYKTAVFEVGPEAANKKFSSETYRITWDDIQLSEGTQKGVNYYLTLKKGLESMKLIVYPVLEGKEYQTAAKDYEAKEAAFTALKNQRAGNEQTIRHDVDSYLANLTKKRQSLESQWKQNGSTESLAHAANNHSVIEEAVNPLEKEMIRSFSLSNFGIYNCDCPIDLPGGAQISIRVTDENGKDLGSKELYLVDKKVNGLFKFSAKAYTDFRFDPAAPNVAWTVIGNKIYILKESEFSKLHTQGQEVLHMTAINRDFKDADEIRAFMGI
jgi:hypothetical protein